MKIVQAVTVQMSKMLFEASPGFLESLCVHRGNLHHDEPTYLARKIEFLF